MCCVDRLRSQRKADVPYLRRTGLGCTSVAVSGIQPSSSECAAVHSSSLSDNSASPVVSRILAHSAALELHLDHCMNVAVSTLPRLGSWVRIPSPAPNMAIGGRQWFLRWLAPQKRDVNAMSGEPDIGSRLLRGYTDKKRPRRSTPGARLLVTSLLWSARPPERSEFWAS